MGHWKGPINRCVFCAEWHGVQGKQLMLCSHTWPIHCSDSPAQVPSAPHHGLLVLSTLSPLAALLSNFTIFWQLLNIILVEPLVFLQSPSMKYQNMALEYCLSERHGFVGVHNRSRQPFENLVSHKSFATRVLQTCVNCKRMVVDPSTSARTARAWCPIRGFQKVVVRFYNKVSTFPESIYCKDVFKVFSK